MEQQEQIDSFKILEDKVGTLITHVKALRNEKEGLEKKIREKDRIITDLNLELSGLRDIKNKAKDRIDSILEKISELDI